MPNDPHRDALAAALARVDALEEQNRELREGAVRAPPQMTQPKPNDIDVDAIDETLRELSQRLDEHAGLRAPAIDLDEPEPRPARGKHAVKCTSCNGTRTVEATLERKKTLTLSAGIEELRVGHARVCSECGYVALRLDERSRLWLDANYLTAMLSEND